MKTLLTTAVLVLLSFTMTNCSSSDDEEGKPEENTTATLTTGEWTLERFEISNVDKTSTLDTCQRQETFAFNADGTFTNKVYTTNNEGACDLITHTGTFTDISDSIGLKYKLDYTDNSRQSITFSLSSLTNRIQYSFNVTDEETLQVLRYLYDFVK